MPKRLFAIAEQEGIIVRWWNFVPPIEGLYWAPSDLPPVIGLDNSLQHNHRKLRTVLAEELGHHFTTTSRCICRTFCSYHDRICFSKDEYKAHKWAALYLIPLKQLTKALKSGANTLWDLTELFDVTEEMMRFRLKLPDILRLARF